MSKVLIPLSGDEIAPRFDLCTEVWIGELDDAGQITDDRILVMPQASAEDLCQYILSEKTDTVVCGGIETEYYDFLCWKKIAVFDSVIATRKQALNALSSGTLTSGQILYTRLTHPEQGGC